MKIKKGFISANGTNFYYEEVGTGSTLILVHGSSTDTRMWDDQFQVLANYYRVLRYDMRGHGKSDLPNTEPYSHAIDLNAIMGHLSIEKAHLAGLSSGGTTVIDFALSYPDKILSLIPISISPTNPNSTKSSTSEIDAAIVTTFNESGKMAATQIAYEHPVFNPAIKNPRTSKRMKQYLDEADFWRMSRKDPIITEPSQITQLHNILVPTLIIIGELDIPEIHTGSDSLVNGIKRSEKYAMSGCGHMVNMEDPEIFNSLVLDFLEKVEGRTPN